MATGEKSTDPVETIMTDLELALLVIGNSFGHWVTRCAARAEIRGLSFLDLQLHHFLCVRRRPLKASDLAFALSIEDVHLVGYSLRKLVKIDYVSTQRAGKETFYQPTASSFEQFDKYVEFRRTILIDMVKSTGRTMEQIVGLAKELTFFSGIYEQAARSAASL